MKLFKKPTALHIRNMLPDAPNLRKLIGPSFILLGLGLGSGEVILWPYLTSNYGLGIVWGIVVGITIQFFINMEVERYALVNGESIFVGFTRVLSWLPLWFIFTTFLGFGWPGIGLAGATLIGGFLGLTQVKLIAVILFLIIGLALTLGSVLYKTVETVEKYLISIGVPFIAILTIYFASQADFGALTNGLIGQGEGYRFLPEGLAITAFFAALAYSGAGGNLNLAQSFYVRDKGYGMGAFASRITGLFRSKQVVEEVRLTGETFDVTNPHNISQFKLWWKRVNQEHFVLFWGLGLISMLMLALLAYATSYGNLGNAEGISFIIHEASVIGSQTLPIIGTFFLLVLGLMLTATQMTILDSTSRIITENILLLGDRKGQPRVARTYFIVLWAQILFGIGIFLLGFDQPLTLITLGAIFNAFSMFVYIGLLLWTNHRLPQPLRPSIFRTTAMSLAFIFFGVFCGIILAGL